MIGKKTLQSDFIFSANIHRESSFWGSPVHTLSIQKKVTTKMPIVFVKQLSLSRA